MNRSLAAAAASACVAFGVSACDGGGGADAASQAPSAAMVSAPDVEPPASPPAPDPSTTESEPAAKLPGDSPPDLSDADQQKLHSALGTAAVSVSGVLSSESSTQGAIMEEGTPGRYVARIACTGGGRVAVSVPRRDGAPLERTLTCGTATTVAVHALPAVRLGARQEISLTLVGSTPCKVMTGWVRAP